MRDAICLAWIAVASSAGGVGAAAEEPPPEQWEKLKETWRPPSWWPPGKTGWPAWSKLTNDELVEVLHDGQWGQAARSETDRRLREYDADAQRPFTRLLLDLWRRDVPPEVRIPLFRQLARVDDEAVRDELRNVLIDRLLNSPDRSERKLAARDLGELKDPRALPALEGAAKSDKGSPVGMHGRDLAAEAVRAAGYMGPAATPFLLRVLGNPRMSYGYRDTVAWSLGNTGDPAGIPALAEILADEDGYQHLREVAAGALGRIGGNEAAAILERYREDRNPMVRERVSAALAQLRESSAPRLPRVVENAGVDPAPRNGTVQGTGTPTGEPVPAEPCPSSSAVTGQEAGRTQAVEAEPSPGWPYLMLGCIGTGAVAVVGGWLLLRRRARPPRAG